MKERSRYNFDEHAEAPVLGWLMTASVIATTLFVGISAF